MGSIDILGLACSIEESRSATQDASSHGVDVAEYRGWPRHCVAPDDRHPSDMASEALGRALERAGIAAGALDLILYTGVSRDFLPSWSVSTEIADRVGAHCAGIDLMLGCLGMLTGLEVARGWLCDPGRHTVAVVTAEKWSFTVDRTDLGLAALWAHSDGGAAAIATSAASPRAIARFHGASFVSLPRMNGFVQVKYGGTRYPVAPAGCDPFSRTLREDPRRELYASYIRSFEQVIRDACERHGTGVERMVCNQVSPGIVSEIERQVGLQPRSVPRTGERYGHVGGADLVLGLEELIAAGGPGGPVILASSCPYCFAAGVAELLPADADGARRSTAAPLS